MYRTYDHTFWLHLHTYGKRKSEPIAIHLKCTSLQNCWYRSISTCPSTNIHTHTEKNGEREREKERHFESKVLVLKLNEARRSIATNTPSLSHLQKTTSLQKAREKRCLLLPSVSLWHTHTAFSVTLLRSKCYTLPNFTPCELDSILRLYVLLSPLVVSPPFSFVPSHRKLQLLLHHSEFYVSVWERERERESST